MFLKCDTVVDGPGPAESIVTIRTERGSEEVVVYSGSIKNSALHVGLVLERKEELALVELPRESSSGNWRVWVPQSALAAEG